MIFEYDSYLRGPCKVICLKGRFIEHSTAENLLTELEVDVNRNTDRFLVDLSGLQYINSIGINSIVKMVHLINRHGGNLVFASGPGKVRELLELIRLNSVISIYDTQEEGIAALN